MKREYGVQMIRWLIVIFMIAFGVYMIFLVASPFLVAFLQVTNARPKSKQAAVKNGEEFLDRAKTVVAIGAHPDDLEWYAGGTLAGMSKNGVRIIAVITTDDVRRVKVRQDEQLKAAKEVGYEKVIFLGYPDGLLNNQSQQKIAEKLEEVYRDYKPDTIVTFDTYDQGPIYHHVDHIATGKAAIKAAQKMNIQHIYLFHSGRSDTWVDISKEIDVKIRGREAHKSQTRWFITPFGMGYIIREAAFLDGMKAGLKYAEPFRKLR